MNWLSAIGEAAKTVRVIWQDVVLLIKDYIRRVNIEKDINTNSSAVDELRKHSTPDSRNENPS